MKITDLCVQIKQVNNALKLGFSYEKYFLKVNKFLKKVLYKLEKDNIIDQLTYRGNTCSFRPCNVIELKKLDRLNFKIKDYKKIYNQFKSPYCELLVTTSKGILTLTEARELNIGGVLLAKYIKKHE